LTLPDTKLQPIVGGDKFDVKLKQIKIGGLSSFILKDLTPKLTQLRFRIALLFPKLVADCNFVVNGSIYEVFLLNGAGTATVEYNDVLVRTTVNLELVNGTLRITTADPPMVDFQSTKMKLKNYDGRETSVEHGQSPVQNMASELGPLLFWMLADQVVEEIDYYAAKYVNDAIKGFEVPEWFKPMVTWLVRRKTTLMSSLSPLYPGSGNSVPLRRYSPISVLGEIVQVLNQVKPTNFVLPSALESLRSSFRSNLRRFL